jgi:hypothetical protein
MKTAFRALVHDGDRTPTEVTIALDGDVVSLSTGHRTIGTWRSGACSFERKAPMSYRFTADGDALTLRVPDDLGFRAALLEMHQQQAPLVPRWLGLLATTVVAAAVAAAAFGVGETPAGAAEATGQEAAGVATTVGPTVPAPIIDPAASSGVEWSATDLAARWNQASPAGSGLTLSAPGVEQVAATLTVSITDGRIQVLGTPTAHPDANQKIIGAMGVAVAAADPSLEPPARRVVLESMGLDIDGSNSEPIDATIEYRDVEYHLVVVPAERVEFTATR